MRHQLRQAIRRVPSLYYPVQKTVRQLDLLKGGADFYLANALRNVAAARFDYVPEKSAKPTAALIEITNSCNLNCAMCNTKSSIRENGLITKEAFEKIVIDLKSVGIQSAGLHTVGETFVYKKINELLAIAEKHNFFVGLTTNAQLPERIKATFEEFPLLANSMSFSIDGATKETYEDIRIGGTFEKVIESLEVVNEINKGKPNYKLSLSVDCVLSIRNIYEIPLFFEKFTKYVWPERINFHLINGLSPDTSYFAKMFPFKNLVLSSVPCAMPFESIYFTYDAQATLCCRDYDGELTVGDIMDNSIDDIWNGEAAESVRAQHRDPSTLKIDACKNCFHVYPFADEIVNNYIHFMRLKHPKLQPMEFGQKVLVLLENMDAAMANKDLIKVRKVVEEAFQ